MAVSYPIYLHRLGYETYGLWLVLSAVLSFAQLSSFGLSPAVTKLVAEDKARNRPDGLTGYLGTALLTLLFSGSMALILLTAFRRPIAQAFGIHDRAAATAVLLLPWVGVLCLAFLVADLLGAALSGLGRIDLTNYTQAGSQVVGAACAILLLRLGYGVESLLIGNALAFLALQAVAAAYLVRMTNLRLVSLLTWDVQRFRRLTRLGGGVAGGSLLAMLLSPFNRLVLSRFGGLATIPVYDIAFSGSLRMKSLLESGIRAIMPEISRVGASGGNRIRARINHINRRAYVVIFVAGAPVFVTVALVAAPALHLWLGARYTGVLPAALRIALLGTFLSLLATPPYFTLMGLGIARHIFGSFVVQSSTNVAMVLLAVLASGTLSVSTALWGGALGMGVCLAYLSFFGWRTVSRFGD
ncbi:MAG TPA: oligosaccharide flippase family protein [Bryobacteraceae bacterium]|nr:oligosaccharide flippase family protein [Bryobacteraceae bacterium]